MTFPPGFVPGLAVFCLIAGRIRLDLQFPGKGSDIMFYAVHGPAVFTDINCLHLPVFHNDLSVDYGRGNI